MSSSGDSSALWRWVDEAVEILAPADRLAVRTAVADNVLEGWQPTKVDIEMLVAVASGATTAEEYRAWVRRDSGHSEMADTDSTGASFPRKTGPWHRRPS